MSKVTDEAANAVALTAEREALWMLGFFYLRHRRPDKALTLFATLQRLVPTNPRLARALALSQIRAGKPDKAIETLDELAMAGSIDPAFHLLRAQALDALGRAAEASAAMRAYIASRGEATAAVTKTTEIG